MNPRLVSVILFLLRFQRRFIGRDMTVDAFLENLEAVRARGSGRWLVWRIAWVAVRWLRRHYERQIGTAWNRDLLLTLDRLLAAEEALR